MLSEVERTAQTGVMHWESTIMILVIGRWRAVALALAVAGAPAQAQTARETGSPIAHSDVRALAHLEPESGAIVVGARPGMRVEQVRVAAGQDVEAGELLAVLEGHDQRERQLALAEAQRDAARFQRRLRRDQLALERARFDRLKQTRLDSLRATVADLKGKVGKEAGAKSGQTGSDKEAAVKSSVPAMSGGMVPQEVRDMLSAQLRAELARTEIQLKEFEATLELLARQRKLEDEVNGEDSPASVVLDRQVELARSDLASAEVRAPVKGRVLAVSVHAGEVSPGPLLTLGDVQTMVARAEVFQTNVLDVAVGDSAEVFILGRTVAGEVTRVGATVARNTITSLDPADLADRRVVAVVVRLADSALAARLVNMQVEVAIRKNASAGTVR
jgi:HlyD family secretion protein